MPQASALSAHLHGKLRAAAPDASLAMLFPGQGSHQVGAGRDLCDSFPLAREVFQRCDEALRLPLSQICFQGPEELLRDTANAQPAILAVSLACLAAGLESGALQRRPAFMAGHSLGEFTALVAAGALELEDAVSLVGTRGRLMAEASQRQPGTMTAIIGLNGEALDEVCRRTGVQPCNYNSPSQAVVGGPLPAVEEASRLAREQGGRALPLNVSGAFHTSLMAPAAEEFAAAVDAYSISDPSIPIIANSTAEPLTTAAAVRQELRQQIMRPVLWHQSMLRMISAGVTSFIETGPGRVLSGLVKRAGPGLTAVSLDSVDSLDALRHV
ncbi:MAG: ACP S-malonyltransferase [Dehalococcoidia bacterium]|nr:MAG: ACP S-malonyltransferase [Dehalococcoidia bacterium]